ncbi:MAG: ABC transporter permease, partial [Candidatus Brocadiae bacterium]|nr:ABC transporter permease [Candidatus Brocadiia bacterium]
AATLAFAGRRVPPDALLAVTTVAFFAIALTGPQLTFWAARAARPLLRKLFRIEGYLAADSLSRTPQRTALTVSAFGGAISLMIATSSIVGSLQLSTERWMEDSFPFDLSVNATDLQSALYSSAAYSTEVLEISRAVPGVASAYGVRAVFVPRGEIEIMLMSVDVAEFFAMHRARGRSAGPVQFDTPAIVAALRSGDGVIISDNFAELNRLDTGGTVTLPSPAGPRTFRILGRAEDYSWPAGTVLMDRSAYARLWGDDSLTYTDILLAPGADEREVRRALSEKLKDRTTVFIYSVPQLQEIARSTLAQALRLSYVQVLIALVIGFLGIVNTLLISVLLRTREIGLLRAVGTTRAQIRRGVMIEAVFIALTGSALGVFAGLAGSGWPIRLYILAKTGFWMPFVIPWSTLALAAGAGAVLGIAASLVPARRAARLNVLEAIAWE